MLSVFGIDLTQPAQFRKGLCGPANGAAATAAFSAIADHFGLSFDQVRGALAPFLPMAMPHFRTAEGWALLGSYLACEVPDAPPFVPMVH